MTHHILDRSMLPGRLDGKTALVTGSSRRIGRAIAVALAEEGVNVVAHDRKSLESETNQTCDEVVGCGAKSWKVIADLEKPEEYESMIATAIQMAGSLDFLVNNASIFLPGGLADLDFNDITRHMQINAWAPFVLSREFARLAGKGKIVNLLDTKITGDDRKHAGYILSKHMLAVLTKMCALEFAPRITVNAIAPGFILPPMGQDEKYLEGLTDKLPLRRHGGPDDIVKALLYLLESDFVTGQTLYVDGGRHLLDGADGPYSHS